MAIGEEIGLENGRATMNPKIAIVIPAHNAADTLDQTVDSIRAQTVEDWELVIVDDGSRDATFAVAERIAESDPRITALTQPNAGVSAARNAGIATTSAPILGFVDADDLWFPTFAQHIIETLDSDPAVGIVFGRAEIRTPELEPTGIVSSFPDRPVDLELLVATNPAATCSTIGARRTALDDTKGFAEDLRRCEDHHFLLAAHLAGWKVAGIDEPLVAYRTSPDGLSANLEGMRDSWEAMVAKLGPERLGPTLDTARAEHHFYLARRALRLRRPRETFGYLRQAFASDPKVPITKTLLAPITVVRRKLAAVQTSESRKPDAR